jgi:hypothetical protein
VAAVPVDSKAHLQTKMEGTAVLAAVVVRALVHHLQMEP